MVRFSLNDLSHFLTLNKKSMVFCSTKNYPNNSLYSTNDNNNLQSFNNSIPHNYKTICHKYWLTQHLF
ncbi:hypothetical protein MARI151_10467 [Maribacter litoralis]|uniref:Uncharacterized protein n=1 Tax=Maribacter litoralis TaxID=2059726 RepID=A0A653MSB0_9FLAO|nr:hypothetical protein MARI151_10467 [Maribacter litoralis]